MPFVHQRRLALLMTFVVFGALCGVGCGGSGGSGITRVMVTSVDDHDMPVEDETTLRMAANRIRSGGTISFDSSLNGATIELRSIDTENTILKGEAFDGGTYLGFVDRSYGRSALFFRGDVTIDASDLPAGVTIAWRGDGPGARVIAVDGNLTLINVTLTGGWVEASPLDDEAQPWTLARGAGIAVWGLARLVGCTVHDNHARGDLDAARDRGAFGGGIYADRVDLLDTVVSGNTVEGYGAAGGGVYSVGGVISADGSRIERSVISGNRIKGHHAYGGGVYSDGGSRGNLRAMTIANSTLARNLVEPQPLPEDPPSHFQYYYRGGGFYMSNGYLVLHGCTVVENAVRGHRATFHSRPNMGGGGVGATIGDAHTVESMTVGHSIIAGNTIQDLEQDPEPRGDDLYTGSLIDFFSVDYNRIGVFDAEQILVPIRTWYGLNRKHLPKEDDRLDVSLSEVVDTSAIERHPFVLSRGLDDGEPAVWWYRPDGDAVNQISPDAVRLDYRFFEYGVPWGSDDTFIEQVLLYVNEEYPDALQEDYERYLGATFHAVPNTWPRDSRNVDWIDFWRTLEADLQNSGVVDSVGLGDAFWRRFAVSFSSNDIFLRSRTARSSPIRLMDLDQRGYPRPAGGFGDVGAIERDALP